MTVSAPVEFLQSLFTAALAAVDPMSCVARHLPPRPRGRTLVLGAGKASARMALALEAAWDGPLSGLVVTRYGHAEACHQIEVLEAGHPVPDSAGAQAAGRMLALASTLGPDDLLLALMSGGGSSLLSLPPPGMALEELRAINQSLLRSGAHIGEMNLVRRHLSAIAGGRLSAACGRAALCTLVVSDVPGDNPATVASGPTLADGSTPDQALLLLQRYGIEISATAEALLRKAPAPACTGLGSRSVHVVATAAQALTAAARLAQENEVEVLDLGGRIEGESREVARVIAGIALAHRERRQHQHQQHHQQHPQQHPQEHHQQQQQRPLLLLSGGETTVTVRGSGRGGRNAEFLLALALALDGETGVHALACDTDGIDGVEDNAGGWIAPNSLRRARAAGVDPQQCLMNNDAHRFLAAAGSLVITGPTRTNVNDFRAVLIQ